VKLLAAMLLLAFGASCEDAAATVNVYRLRQYQMSARKITVFCDGKEVARLANGGYFTLKLSPGEHTLTDKKAPASLTLTVEAGTEYFVRAEWQGGIWGPKPRFSLTAPEQGRNDLNQVTASK
jgi:hypothetical protein